MELKPHLQFCQYMSIKTLEEELSRPSYIYEEEDHEICKAILRDRIEQWEKRLEYYRDLLRKYDPSYEEEENGDIIMKAIIPHHLSLSKLDRVLFSIEPGFNPDYIDLGSLLEYRGDLHFTELIINLDYNRVSFLLPEEEIEEFKHFMEERFTNVFIENIVPTAWMHSFEHKSYYNEITLSFILPLPPMEKTIRWEIKYSNIENLFLPERKTIIFPKIIIIYYPLLTK